MEKPVFDSTSWTPGKVFSGPCKWFDYRKGYGFVVHPELGDVLVHYSVLEMPGFKALKENELVEYTVKVTNRGASATWARPVA
jgi:CspA family cold shock protein